MNHPLTILVSKTGKLPYQSLDRQKDMAISTTKVYIARLRLFPLADRSLQHMHSAMLRSPFQTLAVSPNVVTNHPRILIL